KPRDDAGLSILRLAPGIKVGLLRLFPGVGAARLVPLVLQRGAAGLVPGIAAAVGLAIVEIAAGAAPGSVDAARGRIVVAVVAVTVIGLGWSREGDGDQRRQCSPCVHDAPPLQLF